MQYQFPNTATMGYGWTGIGVALIGQREPLGVVLAGLFIGALRTGATSMQVANIPKTFSNIIEGMAVGFIALQVAVRYYLVKIIQHRRTRSEPRQLTRRPQYEHHTDQPHHRADAGLHHADPVRGAVRRPQ